jgi:DNA polymerase-3 subunit epsilon
MSDQTYAFVDIETTGSSPTTGRITEVAIIIMRDHEVIDTFQSLVNPETSIPAFITKVTGIDEGMVKNAPRFEDIAQVVWEKLQDCTFVAHNVRFDYGFLKNEFKRHNFDFSAKTLCTVKLSRQLYPQHSRHGLDALITRFNLNVENRHRALDDCQLMIDLWGLWHQADAEALMAAVQQQLRGPILPKNLAAEHIENLPRTPGVYYFYAEKDSIPLYIGKSVDIRKRVLSHFSGDHLSSKQAKMVGQIAHINYHQTTGELGALLHEAEQIKEYLPVYNRQLRRLKTMYTLQLQETKDYHTVEIKEIEPAEFLQSHNYYGSFKSQREAKKVLDKFVLELGLCEQLLGLTKGNAACFSHQLGKCHGACIGKVLPIKYNLALQQALLKYKLKRWYFDGPIAIKERCENQERSQVHFFDQWCYLGTLEASNDEPLNVADLNPPKFDVDHYKILQRFFRQPRPLNTELIKLKGLEDYPF